MRNLIQNRKWVAFVFIFAHLFSLCLMASTETKPKKKSVAKKFGFKLSNCGKRPIKKQVYVFNDLKCYSVTTNGEAGYIEFTLDHGGLKGKGVYQAPFKEKADCEAANRYLQAYKSRIDSLVKEGKLPEDSMEAEDITASFCEDANGNVNQIVFDPPPVSDIAAFNKARKQGKLEPIRVPQQSRAVLEYFEYKEPAQAVPAQMAR